MDRALHFNETNFNALFHGKKNLALATIPHAIQLCSWSKNSAFQVKRAWQVPKTTMELFTYKFLESVTS